MWIPLLLKALNESEMQKMGMKMTAEDIYSVNNGSLKDAIVHFGGFCTGEIISDQGLILTNHHCGYGQIQSHSTLENNYLEDGFWAKTKADELTNPGLYVTFIDRIEDVTAQVMEGVTNEMSSKERQSQIDKNLDAIKKHFVKKDYEEVLIRPFFKGNQYFAFVTLTYNDVRLVGAPPSSIGKFGADTDNWVWPRHTGDFSLFRVYAGKDNLPAEYSEDNIPFTPKHSLPISLSGVEEGDFTMVFGFPGRTDSYLPLPGMQMEVDVLHPAKIGIRDKTLAIYNREMRADPQVNIQYASKQSGLSNAWKKWQGVILGVNRTDGMKKKERFEKKFQIQVDQSRAWQLKYGNLLGTFQELYAEVQPYALSRDYYNEVTGRNVELLRVTRNFLRLIDRYESQGENGYESFKARLKPYMENFFKDYRPEIDEEVFAVLSEHYVKNMELTYVPEVLTNFVSKNGGDFTKTANMIYSQSILTSKKKTMQLLSKSGAEARTVLLNDPAFQLMKNWKKKYDDKIAPEYNRYNEEIQELMRTYMAALIEVFPDMRFYPDANSTMRVSYGQVEPYEPKDAVKYEIKTYLGGVMEKYVPGDYEFDVPEKLRRLYQSKDYGKYAERDRKMPVCFIGSNHTTGGNSGSPAIDAHGNLIGLNFDRAWEGTMSDINYDRSICRNIMVDARYILFIIDKFAGAKHLVDEMKLVRPKLETATPERAKVRPYDGRRAKNQIRDRKASGNQKIYPAKEKFKKE